jgi:hypothetical protein
MKATEVESPRLDDSEPERGATFTPVEESTAVTISAPVKEASKAKLVASRESWESAEEETALKTARKESRETPCSRSARVNSVEESKDSVPEPASEIETE